MNIEALAWAERFNLYLTTERRVSPHTVSNYGRDLAALVAFCDREKLEDWSAIEVKHVRAFAARSHRRGLSPQSVQRRLSAVRTFMRFLIREGVIGANFAELVQAPKAARRLPAVLDADQMARLIQIRGDEWSTVRDRAIMELLYSSALRLAELTGLNCGDVDFIDRIVRVFGKGSKERLVPVGRLALEALRRWLNVRDALRRKTRKPSLSVVAGGGSGDESCRRGSHIGDAGRGSRSLFTPICFGTRARHICWSRAVIFARCRRCWGTRASPRPAFTPIWTFRTWPRCTTLRTRGRPATRRQT